MAVSLMKIWIKVKIEEKLSGKNCQSCLNSSGYGCSIYKNKFSMTMSR